MKINRLFESSSKNSKKLQIKNLYPETILVIEDDKWVGADAYFAKIFEAEFSHGLCPACIKELYPSLVTDGNDRAY